MNAGGNRSGTRFTPRMADAATQTYLYGSSAPIPSKANHRMGAAGGGLRDSHLLRGGARETYYLHTHIGKRQLSWSFSTIMGNFFTT